MKHHVQLCSRSQLERLVCPNTDAVELDDELIVLVDRRSRQILAATKLFESAWASQPKLVNCVRGRGHLAEILHFYLPNHEATQRPRHRFRYHDRRRRSLLAAA